MGHEDELRCISELAPVDREHAEKLHALAIANPRDPIYGGFRQALRLGSQPIVAAWLTAHRSGRPYDRSDPLWSKAVGKLQEALILEEQRERVSMGLPADETDLANAEYFDDLMNRDD